MCTPHHACTMLNNCCAQCTEPMHRGCHSQQAFLQSPATASFCAWVTAHTQHELSNVDECCIFRWSTCSGCAFSICLEQLPVSNIRLSADLVAVPINTSELHANTLNEAGNKACKRYAFCMLHRRHVGFPPLCYTYNCAVATS